MKRVLHLDTMEKVRIMADPYRVKIQLVFSRSEKALTVQDVAYTLDEPHGKVYYHIKKMLSIGALEVVRTQQFNCFVAKYMELAYDEIQTSPEFEKDTADSLCTVIDETFDEHKDNIKNIMFNGDENLKNVEKQIAMVGSTLYFDDESYDKFLDEIAELLKKYSNEDGSLTEKTMFYSVYSKQKRTYSIDI